MFIWAERPLWWKNQWIALFNSLMQTYPVDSCTRHGGCPMMYTLYTLSCCHWERAGADCRIPRMLCIKEELTIGLLEYIEYTANVHRISSPLCGYLGLNMYSQSPCTSSRGDDLCLSEIKLFNGKVWQGPMFFSFARLLVFFLSVYAVLKYIDLMTIQFAGCPMLDNSWRQQGSLGSSCDSWFSCSTWSRRPFLASLALGPPEI